MSNIEEWAEARRSGGKGSFTKGNVKESLKDYEIPPYVYEKPKESKTLLFLVATGLVLSTICFGYIIWLLHQDNPKVIIEKHKTVVSDVVKAPIKYAAQRITESDSKIRQYVVDKYFKDLKNRPLKPGERRLLIIDDCPSDKPAIRGKEWKL